MLALDELQHLVVGADIVRVADVGMVEGGHHAGLALEAIAGLLREDFDGHIAPQPRIVRPVHLAYSAPADGGEVR